MKICAALFSGAGLVVVSVQLEGAEGHQAACVGLQARGCFVSSKTLGVVVGDMRGPPLVRRWSLWNAYHCDACSCNNCCFAKLAVLHCGPTRVVRRVCCAGCAGIVVVLLAAIQG